MIDSVKLVFPARHHHRLVVADARLILGTAVVALIIPSQVDLDVVPTDHYVGRRLATALLSGPGAAWRWASVTGG
jgi:hypothetical protein